MGDGRIGIEMPTLTLTHIRNSLDTLQATKERGI